jgi:hypothetical protein
MNGNRKKIRKNFRNSLEKSTPAVYLMGNTGSISKSGAASFHRPHLVQLFREDDDKLSLCGVTMLPTDSGRERMVAHFFVSSKNGRYEKRETKVAESKDF